MTNVLERPTLVLNKNWQAVDIRPVLSAFCKVYAGNARIVDTETYALCDWEDWANLRPKDDDFTVKCVGGEIKVPEVIVTNDYGKIPRRTVTFNRRNLFLRDKNTCQYCGKKLKTCDVTVDHVNPKSKGGGSTWENCVVACIKCNSRKADKTLVEANMRLMREPIKPKWKPGYNVKLKIPSWEKFVSAMYWNVELEQ